MKKIDLTCGDFLARVLPDLGMNVVSLRYKGEPILCEIASRPSSPEPFSAAHTYRFPHSLTASALCAIISNIRCFASEKGVSEYERKQKQT